jgi:hypothetical protein
MMTSAMSVTTVLGVVDVNDARGYYHCSNSVTIVKITHGATVLVCSSEPLCIYRYIYSKEILSTGTYVTK